ncbi:MAG: 5'-nucleotidase C-terminal domain-containing protein [Dysgonamonadaceae bacterium]|jgi:2',3'-cyclic-nucleotide 2'-phosphodiesterase (5'-nucleotidase family)|nr:5'-nucleotidase C-terminal domain-containing protein [Dysgonamonadaceae bacterium]
MRLKLIFTALLLVSLVSCKTFYTMGEMSGGITKMGASYDRASDKNMERLVNKYKSKLDKEMNVVIGSSSQPMDYGIPESLLTNFTSDVMKAYGDEHLEGGADIAVMNVHGHRSAMPKGNISIGNLYEIYSFDNSIAFLYLKGADLRKIFDSYAGMGGAGISSNVKLVIENAKVKSVTIDDKSINDNKIYKIVTLDYLADGNNGMDAFKNAVDSDYTGVTLRDVVIDYVKEQTRQGKALSSKLDGRITIKK